MTPVRERTIAVIGMMRDKRASRPNRLAPYVIYLDGRQPARRRADSAARTRHSRLEQALAVKVGSAGTVPETCHAPPLTSPLIASSCVAHASTRSSARSTRVGYTPRPGRKRPSRCASR